MNSIPQFRQALLAWYRRNKRDLPWRRTADPYPIWISEIMLQQTRVAAVIPYFERFLATFPTIDSLASAPEQTVLHLWAGLGYYSRARNLRKAARQIVERGGFPSTYDGIRALAGIGDYTAAAVASIAFGLPYAALDGNVMRVLTRVRNDPSDIAAAATRRRLQTIAQEFLHPNHPGESNQALMELGATVCLPKQPQCESCPVRRFCAAHTAGVERELPVKGGRQKAVKIERTLLIIPAVGSDGAGILAWKRDGDARLLGGFWELPEPHQLPNAEILYHVGDFRHSITNHNYLFHVVAARISRKPKWLACVSLSHDGDYPFSTTTRKALLCLKESKKSRSLGLDLMS